MFGLAGTVERRNHCNLESIERQDIGSVDVAAVAGVVAVAGVAAVAVVAVAAVAAAVVAVVEVAKFRIHFNFSTCLTTC